MLMTLNKRLKEQLLKLHSSVVNRIVISLYLLEYALYSCTKEVTGWYTKKPPKWQRSLVMTHLSVSL